MKKIKYIQSLFTLKPTAALAIIFLLLSIFSCINKNNMIVQISIDKGSEMVSISGVIINCLKPEKNSKETEFDIYIATSYIALNDLINNNKGNYNKVKVRFPENNIIAAIGEPEECAIISTEGIQSPWSVYRVIILKVPVKVEEDKIKSFYMLKNAIYEMIAKSRKKMKEIKYNLLAEKIYENEAYTIVGIDEKNNQIEIQVKGADIGQFEIVLKDSKFVGAPFYGSGVFFEDEYLCAVIYDIISYTPPYTYKGLFIDTILDIVESRLPDIPIPTIKPEEGVIWMDPVEPQIEAGMEFYTDLYIDPGDRNIANYSITLKYNIGIDSVSSQYLKTNSTRGDCGIEPGKNSSQPIVNTSADGVLAISGSIKNIEDVNKNLNIIRIWWVGYKPITISIRVEGNLTDNDGKTISAKGGLGEDRIGIITIYEPIVTTPTPKPIEFWTPAPKPTDAPKRETGEIWLSVSPNQVIREGSGFTTDIFFEQGTEELDFYKFKLSSKNNLIKHDIHAPFNGVEDGNDGYTIISLDLLYNGKEIEIIGEKKKFGKNKKVVHLATIHWQAIKPGNDRIYLKVVRASGEQFKNIRLITDTSVLPIKIFPPPTPEPAVSPISVPTPVPTPERKTGDIWLSLSSVGTIHEGSDFATDIYFSQGTEELNFFEFELTAKYGIVEYNMYTKNNGVGDGNDGFKITHIDRLENSKGIKIIGNGRWNTKDSKNIHIAKIHWTAISNGDDVITLKVIRFQNKQLKKITLKTYTATLLVGIYPYILGPTPYRPPIPTSPLQSSEPTPENAEPKETFVPGETPPGIIEQPTPDSPRITPRPLGSEDIKKIWIYPDDSGILQHSYSSIFKTEIFLSTASDTLIEYTITVYYENDYLALFPMKGYNGVTPGSDGFFDYVNPLTDLGKVIIKGFDLNGVKPGLFLSLLNIFWEGINIGPTKIWLEANLKFKDENEKIFSVALTDSKDILLKALPLVSTITPSPKPTPLPSETPGIGAVWFDKDEVYIREDGFFKTTICINTGSEGLSSFKCDIQFDDSFMELNGERGYLGVRTNDESATPLIFVKDKPTGLILNAESGAGFGEGALYIIKPYTIFWKAKNIAGNRTITFDNIELKNLAGEIIPNTTTGNCTIFIKPNPSPAPIPSLLPTGFVIPKSINSLYFNIIYPFDNSYIKPGEEYRIYLISNLKYGNLKLELLTINKKENNESYYIINKAALIDNSKIVQTSDFIDIPYYYILPVSAIYKEGQYRFNLLYQIDNIDYATNYIDFTVGSSAKYNAYSKMEFETIIQNLIGEEYNIDKLIETIEGFKQRISNGTNKIYNNILLAVCYTLYPGRLLIDFKQGFAIDNKDYQNLDIAGTLEQCPFLMQQLLFYNYEYRKKNYEQSFAHLLIVFNHLVRESFTEDEKLIEVTGLMIDNYLQLYDIENAITFAERFPTYRVIEKTLESDKNKRAGAVYYINLAKLYSINTTRHKKKYDITIEKLYACAYFTELKIRYERYIQNNSLDAKTEQGKRDILDAYIMYEYYTFKKDFEKADIIKQFPNVNTDNRVIDWDLLIKEIKSFWGGYSSF